MSNNTNTQVRKFGMVDKLAYAAGDFGCNMSFALKGTLVTYWTQFIGITDAAMIILSLLVQVWDAINDPVIGAMIDADRRQYKRNKFLQYIHVGSIGLVIGGAFCFLPVQGLPAIAKSIMFIAGYVIWDAFYTIANVPYGSMLSLISADPGDRAELSTFRSVGSMAGNMLTGILLPMLIYDSESKLLGERVFVIALVMGIIGFFFFQFMVRKTVIRVEQEIELSEEPVKFNVLEASIRFFKNRPAVGATLAPVAQFVGMYGAQTANTLLWQSYFKNAQISGLMQMIGMIPMFFFMPFIRKIVARFGKKEAMAFGTIIQTLAYASLFILPVTPDATGIAMWVGASVTAGIGGGIGMCVSWSLMADAMDYGEWKFGVREEGTTYALHSFFRKLAQGVGPSLGIFLVGLVGGVMGLGPNQAAGVPEKLKFLVITINVCTALAQFIAIGLVYNLDKKTVATMQAELEERKEK